MLHGADYTIAIASNYSLTYLETLEIHTFINNFSSLCNKKRPKHISKLFELITTIKSANATLKETVKLVFERYALHEDEFNENLDSIRKYYDKLAIEYTGKLIPKNDEGDFILKFYDIFHKWHKSGQGTSKFITHSMIIEPVLEISRNEPIAEFKQFTVDKSLAASLAYINMGKVDQMLREEVRHTSWLYKRACKLGEKIEKNL